MSIVTKLLQSKIMKILLKNRLGKIKLSIIFAILSIVILFRMNALNIYESTKIKLNNFIEQKMGFKMDDSKIIFNGIKLSDEKLFLSIIKDSIGTNILNTKISEIANEIYNDPWVKNIKVIRKYPDSIIINIEEHKPFATKKFDDSFFVIDEKGQKIVEDTDNLFNGLIKFSKVDNMQQIINMKKMIDSEPILSRMVSEVIKVDKRWDIILNNDTRIKLPSESPEIVWHRIAIAQQKIPVINKKKRIIDLVSIDTEYIDEKIIQEYYQEEILHNRNDNNLHNK